MKTSEILRKKLRSQYTGYDLQRISETSMTLESIKTWGFKRLQRIPGKITAFLHRDKIKEVYKSQHAKDPIDNYYLIITTDGTIFDIGY